MILRRLVRCAATARKTPLRSRLELRSLRSGAPQFLLTDQLMPRAAIFSSQQISTFHTSTSRWKASEVASVNDAPFEKLMAANRGEIATRIVRAAAELGIKTAGIYAHEGMKVVLESILSLLISSILQTDSHSIVTSAIKPSNWMELKARWRNIWTSLELSRFVRLMVCKLCTLATAF